jgi:hypothetical protein
MQLTVMIALSVALALAVLGWRRRVRNRNRETPEARYRNDIKALKRRRRTPDPAFHSEDIWSAGADPAHAHSRATKAAAWVALGAVGGCGGCGGCGCGG